MYISLVLKLLLLALNDALLILLLNYYLLILIYPGMFNHSFVQKLIPNGSRGWINSCYQGIKLEH